MVFELLPLRRLGAEERASGIEQVGTGKEEAPIDEEILLLCAGEKGKRFALPNARVMVHQPSGGAQGQATDIEIQAREILNLRKRLNQIYVEHTGQPLEAIEAKLERDSYLSAQEAKEFGLIDEVVKNQPPFTEGKTDSVSPVPSEAS